MATLARTPNPKVRQYAERIMFSKVSATDALDTWLRNNYRYRSEEKEIVRTPEFMLNDLEKLGYAEGDCDDVATLAAALAVSAGFPARLTAIASIYDNPNRDLDHVFAEVGIDFVPVDPTVSKGTVYQCTAVVHEVVA